MNRILISLSIAVGLAAPAVTLAVTAPASPAFSQNPFTDVAKTHANYDAIEYLRQHNVLKGYPDGTFRPDTRISRAEFVMLMTNPLFLTGMRNDECKTGSGSMVQTFPDVPRDAWYADQVCVAAANKIVNGYADGLFRPNQNLNFVETAKVAATVLQLHNRKDAPSDDRWYTAYVLELADENAIPTTIKRLDQLMTRGDMAEILYRLKANVNNKSSKVWDDFKNQ